MPDHAPRWLAPLGAVSGSEHDDHAADGACARLLLTMEERDVVNSLLSHLRDKLVQDSDLSLWRLFPPAYADDVNANMEYHDLMRGQLLGNRLEAIEESESLLTQEFLTEDQLWTLAKCLNDLRLMFSAMLGIDDDDDVDELADHFDANPDDPRGQLLSSYEILGYLLEEAMDCVTGE
jgi:hypothetical protein